VKSCHSFGALQYINCLLYYRISCHYFGVGVHKQVSHKICFHWVRSHVFRAYVVWCRMAWNLTASGSFCYCQGWGQMCRGWGLDFGPWSQDQALRPNTCLNYFPRCHNVMWDLCQTSEAWCQWHGIEARVAGWGWDQMMLGQDQMCWGHTVWPWS
jgi:hypothetical protein